MHTSKKKNNNYYNVFKITVIYIKVIFIMLKLWLAVEKLNIFKYIDAVLKELSI